MEMRYICTGTSATKCKFSALVQRGKGHKMVIISIACSSLWWITAIEHLAHVDIVYSFIYKFHASLKTIFIQSSPLVFPTYQVVSHKQWLLGLVWNRRSLNGLFVGQSAPKILLLHLSVRSFVFFQEDMPYINRGITRTLPCSVMKIYSVFLLDSNQANASLLLLPDGRNFYRFLELSKSIIITGNHHIYLLWSCSME